MTNRKTQGQLARERYPQLLKEVALVRLREPRRRCDSVWTYYGSGSLRTVARCAFCNRVVATCSTIWPKPNRFFDEAKAHTDQCRVWYWRRYSRKAPTLPMILNQKEEQNDRPTDAGTSAMSLQPSSGSQG